MAKGAYFGVGSTAKKIKKMYIGIGGIARKVKRAYIGIADKARLWFSGGEPEYYKQITLPRLVRNPAATENGDYYMFGTTLGSLPDDPDESVMYLLNSNLTLSSVSPVATKTISSVGRNDKYAFFISVNKDLSSPMVTVYAKNTMEKRQLQITPEISVEYVAHICRIMQSLQVDSLMEMYPLPISRKYMLILRAWQLQIWNHWEKQGL